MKKAKVITFYSFKGGTGRSLALANIAAYLERFKFKVCIVDMDIEAPGIHYKFMKPDDPRIETMQGVVDYIDSFTENHLPPRNTDDYLIDLSDHITLMPSGNVRSADYWKKLYRIDWNSMLYKEDSQGVLLLLDLIGRLKKNQRDFDYILIDARAGITPLSGLSSYALNDALVVFLTTSPESMEGTRQTLRNVILTRQEDGLTPLQITAVLTRFDRDADEDEETRFINEKRLELLDKYSDLFTDFMAIHADRSVERSEHVVFGGRDEDETTVSVNNGKLLPDEPIRLDYLKLIISLFDPEEMEERAHALIDEIVVPDKLLYYPDAVQADVEAIAYAFNYPLFYESLLRIYELRNILETDTERYIDAVNRYCELGGSSEYVAELYGKLAQDNQYSSLIIRPSAIIRLGMKRDVRFGPYTWRVLKVDGNRALLITEDVIEEQPYNTDGVAATWRECSLRHYLNGEFLDRFSYREQASILTIKVINADSILYETHGGEETLDKIFLLSIDEAQGYFTDNKDRVAKYEESASWWWLRSPGIYAHFAALVNVVGYVTERGYNVDFQHGVRPALWLNLISWNH